jgi:hypothetical protein
VSTVSAVASGRLASVHGFGWLVVALAAIGGFVVGFFVVGFAIWAVRKHGGLDLGRRRIRLIFGVGDPFDQYRSRIHFREHRIRICLENRSSNRHLSNCEVTLEKITGRLSHRCPVSIKSGFTLNPGARTFIDFAQLDEANEGRPSLSEGAGGKQQGIVAFFPINPLSDGTSYLDDQPYDLLLKATAAESAPHLVESRLWIEGRAMKLEPV